MAVSLKKKPAVQPLPENVNLRIGITVPLSKRARAAVNEFHAACVDAEKAVEELHDARAELLRSAPDALIGDVVDSGAQLELQRVTLERELEALHVRRHELLPQLVPDLKNALAVAEADRDQVYAAERDRMASLGVTAAAMPAYSHNDAAAELQLTHRISQTDVGLAATARVNIAESELRAWSAAAKAAEPGPERWSVDWRPAQPGFESRVAALAGV